jgi:hypothetical protein
MQSGQVNASLLLASFLGSENEKIGQTIVQHDFAGELKKLMPATANGAGPSALNAEAKPEKVDAADPRLKTSVGETLAGAETKSSPSPSTRERKGATDSRTKINAIKSKAQKEQCLAVTSPAIAATVLADLQYPAQTRKACEGMQNKEGQISIKDLKSLLDTQPAIGSEMRAQVPAEHARALVESIIAKGGGTNLKELASGGTLQSSVQIKTEGSYTPSEFRGLLEKVLQQADTTQAQLAEPGSQPGSVKTAKDLKRGQTESLVETVLPSFISADHENDSTGKIFAGNSNDQTSEAQSAKVRDVRENSIETVSDNLKSEEQLSEAKVVSGGEDHEGVALVTEAGIKGGGTGSSTFPASALPSARQETVSIPVEDLDPVLKYFDARIMSAGPQQPEVNTAPTPAPGGPYEALAAQAQNLAPPVKGAEKQADGPRGTLSSWRLPQDIAEQTEASQIKTVEAEFPSSERSFDGNPNREAVPSSEIQAKAPAPATGHEKIQAQSGETTPGVENDGKTASASQILGNTVEKAVPAAESPAGKLSDSIEAKAGATVTKTDPEEIPVELQETPPGVENDGKTASASQILGKTGEKAVPAAESPAGKLSDSIEAEVGATVTKTDPEEIRAELRETTPGVVNDAKAASSVVREIPVEAGGNMASEPESPLWPWRLGYSTEDFNPRADPSVFGKGPDSGQSVDESAPATMAIDGLRVAESNTTLSGLDTAMLSKQIEKQLGSRDSAPESAVFQNSASSFQAVSEINLPRMENSAQNSFVYYDPYRSAELAQNAREQITGGAARQLVLEMEPDELGKISVKVGAKKDEISVAALTQSEPARQALMRHSPELRQDLQDQGLVLEKFMVDVNREKSGEGNYPEANNPKGKTPPVSKTTKIGGIQAAAGPAYIRKTDSQSRISIFA